MQSFRQKKSLKVCKFVIECKPAYRTSHRLADRSTTPLPGWVFIQKTDTQAGIRFLACNVSLEGFSRNWSQLLYCWEKRLTLPYPPTKNKWDFRANLYHCSNVQDTTTIVALATLFQFIQHFKVVIRNFFRST